MQDGYVLEERVATPEEYRKLCTAVGWGEIINFAAAPRSLAGSVYGVVVTHDGEAVGMGRLVGDGAIYFYVEDVAIDPAHQRRGIGRDIMEALLDYIARTTYGPVFVGLFSTPQAEHLYESLDIRERDMRGMFRVVEGRLPAPPAG